LRVLQHLHKWTPASGCRVLDTLIASRLILPHVSDLDDKAAPMGDPKLGTLRGRYSIAAWGARLGIPKVGIDIKDWSAWTPEIQARCVADVAINKALWEFLQPDGYSPRAMELEHRAAAICNQITADGVPFDAAAAERLYRVWKWRRAKIAAQLAQQFPGTNFNSRKQIGELLEAKGWKPAKRTEKTKQAVIDDETLETIPALYPEFSGLSDHFTLGRRLGQLTNGEEAWSGHVGADGRIHGGLIHIGTPHSRAKHMHPNLAQVPNPKKGKPFAAECRGLFRAPPGWVFVAADQAGLQDRGLAHYLAAHDEGAYARTFLEGSDDTHWKSATALGLTTESRDKQSALHTSLREGAKRFRYAFLYGAGAAKAGTINDTVELQQIDPSSSLRRVLRRRSTSKAPVLERVVRRRSPGSRPPQD
jgi:DNA polymerase I-like protein with 3'-5' exonuclease and polymerase domains